MSLDTSWYKAIKREARGIDDYDLGEVYAVQGNTVITKKGVLGKDKFYFPKNLVHGFDGNKLIIRVTKEQAGTYRRN